MHRRYGTITPAVPAFAIVGLLGSARTLAQSAYIASQLDNTVSVISTATNTVTTVIHDPSLNMPDGIAVTPDGRKVYAVNSHSDSVSVISTATNMVVGSPIPVGKFPAAGGVFIQPRFAGTLGKANCFGQSVAALARTFGASITPP